MVRVVTTLDEFRRFDVDVVSLREGLDFRGPSGSAMAAIIGAIAQMEHEAIRTRVTEGSVRLRRVECVLVGRRSSGPTRTSPS